jgi:hypothetical protein
MKKLLASAILLSAIFLAYLASGQEYQTKGSGTSSKKMKQTTTTTNNDPQATTTNPQSEAAPSSVKPPEGEKQDGKTTPAVQTSKDKPGSGTNTSTQSKPSETGTIGQKETTSEMSSANAIPDAKNIYNGEGKLVATVDAEGWIRNPEQRLLAQYTSEGEYYTKNRVKAGYIDDGVIYDKNGSKYARITKNGDVISMNGTKLGNISADGSVMDNTGKKIGSGPGVDKNVLAVLFFYQKNMASKGYSTGNKK